MFQPAKQNENKLKNKQTPLDINTVVLKTTRQSHTKKKYKRRQPKGKNINKDIL